MPRSLGIDVGVRKGLDLVLLDSRSQVQDMVRHARTDDVTRSLTAFEPDVLILDVMLPYVDGWSVLENIGEMPAERRPKVILVSAAAGVADRAQSEQLDVASVLPKPFDMDELLDLVASMVGPAADRAT